MSPRTPPTQKPGKSFQAYSTPDDFLIAVKMRLGIREFSIDLAADASNRKAKRWFDEQTDALSRAHWSQEIGRGKWGWLNPPFADIAPWAERCVRTAQHGGQVAFLTPASVGANWFADHVYNHALVLALQSRLDFIPGELYPKDCILSLYGPTIAPGFVLWDWMDVLRTAQQVTLMRRRIVDNNSGRVVAS